MFHMPDRGIEKNGVVVVSDCLFYCFINRLTHPFIVLAVTKLSDDETTQMSQYTTQTQVTNHPVNMIVPLGDVFDE
jgi:hypothetical protein